MSQQDAAYEIAKAAKRVVNAPLPIVWLDEDFCEVDGNREHEWWVAKRNMRATLDTFKDLTGVDGEQDS